MKPRVIALRYYSDDEFVRETEKMLDDGYVIGACTIQKNEVYMTVFILPYDE